MLVFSALRILQGADSATGGFVTPAQSPPCAAPYTLPHSVGFVTAVLVKLPGAPGDALHR